MKVLMIAAIAVFSIAASLNKAHLITASKQQLYDTVPYPPPSMQPVEPNPVNGNGTPLNKPNEQSKQPNLSKPDTGSYRKSDTSGIIY